MNEIATIEADHKNVWCALAAAQIEMGTIVKGSVNPAFKSRYADLADVAGVVIPTLARHGIATMQSLTGEGLDVMRTEFVHGASETRVTCDVRLIVSKNDMQGMKSAITYARRIGLESLSGVAPEDDDGNAAAQAAPRQAQREALPAKPREPTTPEPNVSADLERLIAIFQAAPDEMALSAAWEDERDTRQKIHEADADGYERVRQAVANRKAALTAEAIGDTIPF